jgi:hypothetical protein
MSDTRPTLNREAMNISIDATRQAIQITTNAYGWDKWVKVREDIHLLDSSARP